MLDQKIKQAIKRAVQEEGQPDELTNKIVKWIDSLASGNEDMNDQAAYLRRCDVCFNTMSDEEDSDR